jgi:hypothetical protein
VSVHDDAAILLIETVNRDSTQGDGVLSELTEPHPRDV